VEEEIDLNGTRVVVTLEVSERRVRDAAEALLEVRIPGVDLR
jgi:hypothetical protein